MRAKETATKRWLTSPINYENSDGKKSSMRVPTDMKTFASLFRKSTGIPPFRLFTYFRLGCAVEPTLKIKDTGHFIGSCFAALAFARPDLQCDIAGFLYEFEETVH